MSAPRYLIFANGEIHNLASVPRHLRPDDHLLAADGGAKHLRALGLTPHTLIGDLDSIAPTDLAELQQHHTRIMQYPARKDETDLELAIALAVREQASEILIFGALGGRWDQTLANLLLPALTKFAQTPIKLIDDAQTIFLIAGDSTHKWHGHAGATVSLIALSAAAQGVTTQGLEYPLHEGTLTLGSTLGVSNVMLGEEAAVSVKEGLVMCIVISTK